MHKVLIFTDIHITDAGQTIIGLDPLDRFARGLAHALDHHPDAARVIITGDLSHHGTESQYRRLHAVLKTCPIPVSLTLGNHDRRAGFARVFPKASQHGNGFCQEVIALDPYRLIILDTLDEAAPDIHSGLLCPERLDWLDAALSDAGSRPLIVFTHHPPMLTEMKGMDWIGFRNRADLMDRLAAHPAPVQVISGHIHRLITGQVQGVPVTILKSTCHQMPMQLGWSDPHLSADEDGAYGVLLLTEDGPVLHSCDFTRTAATATDDYSKDMRQ